MDEATELSELLKLRIDKAQKMYNQINHQNELDKRSGNMPEGVQIFVLVVFRIHGKELLDIVLRDPSLTVDQQIDKVCDQHEERRSDFYGFSYCVKS